MNRIRRLVPQSVAIAAVPFQYLTHHGIHDTLVRAQDVCLRAPYVSNPFPRVLGLLARKGIAFEHRHYRKQTLGQDFLESCEEDAQFARYVNPIARVGSTFVHRASTETGAGNALQSVYGTYAAVSLSRPEYVHTVWRRLAAVVLGGAAAAGSGGAAAVSRKRDGPFTIETINAFVGDLMLSNILCDARHVDKYLRGGGGQREQAAAGSPRRRADEGAVLHNVQVNVFRLVRVQGTSFLASHERVFAGEVADHIVAMDASPSVVVGHVSVGGRRWTMDDLSERRRSFEAALAEAATRERGDSSTQYWRSDLDGYIFANMHGGGDDGRAGDRARDGQAISALIFCLQQGAEDCIPVRVEYVAYFSDDTERARARKVWSLFEIALLFPRREDALLWHDWCCSSDEDHPLVAAPDVDHADASLIARARECAAGSDWLVAVKLLLFRSAVVLDFTLLPPLVPCVQGPAQSLEGLYNDSLLFDAFDSTASASSSRMIRDCRELLLRFCAHAAVLLHHPSQCHFPGIRSPLLASLLRLQRAETDYSFDAETMDGILEIRDWSFMTARCAARTLFEVYCCEGTRAHAALFLENPFVSSGAGRRGAPAPL